MAESVPVVWTLRAGSDRRFRSGHPWVYSNELAQSPKGLAPGALVELRDAAGKFLARGYGNPHSLIAFRALSRVESEKSAGSPEFLTRVLRSAAQARAQAGLSGFSHRLCFGEADGLPGLIIDRYVLNQGSKQVFVTQAHTAGAERLQASLSEVLQGLCGKSSEISHAPEWPKWPKWKDTAWVVRNDVSVRKLEGLAPEPPRIAHEGLAEAALRDAKIWVAPGVEFRCDLFAGQKTGFFLDQAGNIRETIQHLIPFARSLNRGRASRDPIKILDLCCYVGQWSTQLSAALQAQGIACEVVLVDASAAALELARQNVAPYAAKVTTCVADVIHDLPAAPELQGQGFDVVISDPPALVKSRKDLPQGKHAYLQLHTQALRLVKEDSLVVACSCSGSLDEDDFLATLSKASLRNSKRVRWIARGTHSVDHPALSEFPEGRYLKCWIGFASRTI